MQAELQKKIDAYKKKGGDMKELMERYERGDVVYTKEEGELLPFSGENIPDYIRDKFRAMHQK